MTDLVCLVADKNMKAAIEGVLSRHQALGIRPLRVEVIDHPGHDPGCYSRGHEMLRGFRDSAQHGLMLLDHAFDGAPPGTGAELESAIEASAQWVVLRGWARAIVIDPELEAWVFASSPHVATALGWHEGMQGLRAGLSAHWPADAAKPTDPKAAVEAALRRARQPRSSALYREVAQKVTLDGCQDRAFLRLRDILRTWFGTQAAIG